MRVAFIHATPSYARALSRAALLSNVSIRCLSIRSHLEAGALVRANGHLRIPAYSGQGAAGSDENSPGPRAWASMTAVHPLRLVLACWGMSGVLGSVVQAA